MHFVPIIFEECPFKAIFSDINKLSIDRKISEL